MTSEFCTVDSLCAMTNTVRPYISASMPALHDGFGTGVDGGGRLVQDHDRRVCNRRPRDGDQLALAL